MVAQKWVWYKRGRAERSGNRASFWDIGINLIFFLYRTGFYAKLVERLLKQEAENMAKIYKGVDEMIGRTPMFSV